MSEEKKFDQEQQIKISFYEKHTVLKAEITLPDSDEGYDEALKQKGQWEQKDRHNIAVIR
jgi:hypothetical protein